MTQRDTVTASPLPMRFLTLAVVPTGAVLVWLGWSAYPSYQFAFAVLEQERYLLHALMDNLPHNIYFKDAESRFVRINRALSECFGMEDASEALGKTDFDFFTDEHARQAREDEQ